MPLMQEIQLSPVAVISFHDRDDRLREIGQAVHEYVAYVVQLTTMDENLRKVIMNQNSSDLVFNSDFEINSLVHFIVPHKFGIMSYNHFQNQDQASWLEGIVSGEFDPDQMLDVL